MAKIRRLHSITSGAFRVREKVLIKNEIVMHRATQAERNKLLPNANNVLCIWSNRVIRLTDIYTYTETLVIKCNVSIIYTYIHLGIFIMPLRTSAVRTVFVLDTFVRMTYQNHLEKMRYNTSILIFTNSFNDLFQKFHGT